MINPNFTPDYRHMLDVVNNRQPHRLPVYEHIINPTFMDKLVDEPFSSLQGGDTADRAEFFRKYCTFWRDMTYDTVSFEMCITSILPDGGAIMGGRPGPIQTREDFERYPWDELPRRFWELATPHFDALREAMPTGMKALGGVGNGVFEISEDLVGYEYLAYMQLDDPELFADVYNKIGDLMHTIWVQFLERHADLYAICRFGDDLGYKVSTMVAPRTIRKHMLPQYKRVIDAIHAANKPFLWHSCGSIFSVMEDVIDLGINSKHSNEDVIAPFDTWIERYGDRIGLLGGVDVDILCRDDPQDIEERVFEMGCRFREKAKGYALGSGNSIPEYVPVEGYLAMIRGAERVREAGCK